jgi:lipopolysaccharide export system permease protein
VIINRYLIRAIALPWLTMTAGLALLFAAYSVTRYLSQAASGDVTLGLATQMIGLRVLIALETLVPLGLYLGIIVGLGRLYTDGEIAALAAGGVTRTQMLRPVLGFALGVAVLVAGLSLFVRPWVYSQFYTLRHTAQMQMNIGNITPDRFYSDSDNGMVVYAAGVAPKAKRLDNVFASVVQNDHRVVIRAASMTREQHGDNPPRWSSTTATCTRSTAAARPTGSWFSRR